MFAGKAKQLAQATEMEAFLEYQVQNKKTNPVVQQSPLYKRTSGSEGHCDKINPPWSAMAAMKSVIFEENAHDATISIKLTIVKVRGTWNQDNLWVTKGCTNAPKPH